MTIKELGALQRLAEISSNKETAASIDTFLQSLGLPPGSYETPKLKGKHTWEVDFPSEADTDSIVNTLYKKLGDPVAFSESSDTFWVIRNKGLVVVNGEDGGIRVISAALKDIAVNVVLMIDEYSTDTRFKNYSVDRKNKVIKYTLYDSYGRSVATSLFKKIMKKLGMTGWRVNLDANDSKKLTVISI